MSETSGGYTQEDRWTPEEKARIVRRRLLEGLDPTVLSEETGATPGQIKQWCEEALGQAETAFANVGEPLEKAAVAEPETRASSAARTQGQSLPPQKRMSAPLKGALRLLLVLALLYVYQAGYLFQGGRSAEKGIRDAILWLGGKTAMLVGQRAAIALGMEEAWDRERGRQLGLPGDSYSSGKEEFQMLLDPSEGAYYFDACYFIKYFGPSERIFLKPESWEHSRQLMAQVILDVLHKKRMKPEDLAENLIRAGHRRAEVELLEILIRAYAEKRLLSSFDPIVQSDPATFGRFTDVNGDGITGVRDVLAAICE